LPSNTRDERLVHDLQVMQKLAESSVIVDFESEGDPPEEFTVTFHGRGVTRASGLNVELEFVEKHQFEIRLPFSYPQRAPDIRWLTPIFHPNISNSGFINLEEIDIEWDKDINLDVLCERLWDVVRLDFMNLGRSTNYAACNWFEEQTELQLPLDQRRLRETAAPSRSNVVRYQRRGEKIETGIRPANNDEVLFIGEETPNAIPRPPQRRQSGPVIPRRRSTPSNDDDVFYIGDEE
jgi:ubiquitin-protein ligase